MNQILINILYSFSIYLIVGFSFDLIYRATKFFNLFHAAPILLGAYFTWSIHIQFGASIIFSIVSGIVLSTFIVFTICHFVFKPILLKNTSSFVLLIFSLGLYIILQNLISLFWGDDIKVIYTNSIVIGHRVYGTYITTNQILTLITSIVLFTISVFISQFSKLGRKYKAITSNHRLAVIFGINYKYILNFVFILGSALASIIGICFSIENGLKPTMGFNMLIYGIVAMIIGGSGNNWGIFGGAFLLSAAQHLGAFYIDSKWMEAIAYIILILFLIWRPLGLGGKQIKKVEI